MSTEMYRKCAKCGKTRAEDVTVSYHRFPNPGLHNANISKARAWATYCWPNNDWSSADSLHLLHKQSRVLCGRHFKSSEFYDSQRQKLSIFAVPDSTEVEELLSDRENISKQNVKQSSVSSHPVSQLENISDAPEPSTRALLLIHDTSVEVPKIPNLTGTEQNVKQSSVAGRHISREPFSQLQNLPAAPEPSTSRLSPIRHTCVEVSGTSKYTDTEQISTTSQKEETRKALMSEGLQGVRTQSSKICSRILSAIQVSNIKDMTSRELKLYKICRKKFREVVKLKNALKNKKTDIIGKIYEDKNLQKLCNLNISNSFVVLLQSQLKNCPKKPKGRRYTLQQKIMALVIYKKSPACYRLLRRMFALPCQTSLNKLLNRVPLKPGINEHIFTSLKKMSQTQIEEDNLCLLSFDEMSIRKHVFYDSKQDVVQVFQDHGNHGRKNEIATKALVFMLSGIRKKWKQPIAFYFSHSLNADRMTVILKEILTECFKSNVNVVGTVCDLSTVNLKVLKTLGATTRDPFFLHQDREIVAILDPPHLLKCTQNLFMKHDVEYTTVSQCKGTAKWSHIERFYDLDKNNANFVYAPLLTEHHLRPNVKQQMKVKLAAQIFSMSVTAGILAKIASNELPAEAHSTATFFKNFDELFDAVNAESPDLRRGKKYSTNLTTRSPHIALFQNMRKFISGMKYIGSKKNPPSQEGWIHTMNAVERLSKNLQAKNIKSLSTRRLNQDPLENCFGCIRYSCGSNDNPTIPQFVAGVKTAIITNLRHSGQKKNCEEDTAILSNNLASFLTCNMPHVEENVEAPDFLDCEMEAFLTDAVEAVELGTPEGQACGYVRGFIFKKLRHNDCPDCRITFLTDTFETIHIFTSLKEYEPSQNSLKYVKKNVVQCVENMATIINNYLKTNGWKPQLKNNNMANLDCIDFDYLKKCTVHLELNKNHLKTSTFCICVKRFCILKNREMEDEEKRKAMERKIRILQNK